MPFYCMDKNINTEKNISVCVSLKKQWLVKTRGKVNYTFELNYDDVTEAAVSML